MEYCANISMLYPEFSLSDRIGHAARAGFEWVEIQFVDDDEIEGIITACEQAKIGVIQINTSRGVGDEVGLAALPGRQSDFRDSVSVGIAQAKQLGVKQVNILAGRPDDSADPQTCLDIYMDNIRHAADAFADIGVRVMIEPVNRVDRPGFFLSGLDFTLDVLAKADHPNLAILFDFYHLAITEPDLARAVEKAGAHIGHVQFADVPGRHEPGTGTTDFEPALTALRRIGYAGIVSAEYTPANGTDAGLGWMPRFRELTR